MQSWNILDISSTFSVLKWEVSNWTKPNVSLNNSDIFLTLLVSKPSTDIIDKELQRLNIPAIFSTFLVLKFCTFNTEIARQFVNIKDISKTSSVVKCEISKSVNKLQ